MKTTWKKRNPFRNDLELVINLVPLMWISCSWLSIITPLIQKNNALGKTNWFELSKIDTPRAVWYSISPPLRFFFGYFWTNMMTFEPPLGFFYSGCCCTLCWGEIALVKDTVRTAWVRLCLRELGVYTFCTNLQLQRTPKTVGSLCLCLHFNVSKYHDMKPQQVIGKHGVPDTSRKVHLPELRHRCWYLCHCLCFTIQFH